MKDHPEQQYSQFENMHASWRDLLRRMAGERDIRGIEIGTAIQMLARCYIAALHHQDDFSALSGPRMAILLRLLAEENFGNTQGINPTQISQYQNVSKNTVSSLLRGLEEQGLIERTLDPDDKRRFLIRITTMGRDMVRDIGPERVQMMNQMVSALTDDEQDQLLALLKKLRDSMLTMNCSPHPLQDNDAD